MDVRKFYLDEILKIMENDFFISKSVVMENLDTDFTKKPFSFNFINLTYLFMLVEVKINVKIKECYIEYNEFNSVNQILRILEDV